MNCVRKIHSIFHLVIPGNVCYIVHRAQNIVRFSHNKHSISKRNIVRLQRDRFKLSITSISHSVQFIEIHLGCGILQCQRERLTYADIDSAECHNDFLSSLSLSISVRLFVGHRIVHSIALPNTSVCSTLIELWNGIIFTSTSAVQSEHYSRILSWTIEFSTRNKIKFIDFHSLRHDILHFIFQAQVGSFKSSSTKIINLCAEWILSEFVIASRPHSFCEKLFLFISFNSVASEWRNDFVSLHSTFPKGFLRVGVGVGVVRKMFRSCFCIFNSKSHWKRFHFWFHSCKIIDAFNCK